MAKEKDPGLYALTKAATRKILFDVNTLIPGNFNAEGCNAVMFKNNCRNSPAVNVLVVNGYRVYEGEMLVLSGMEGDLDTTIYSVSMEGAGASQDYQVIRKFYTDLMD